MMRLLVLALLGVTSATPNGHACLPGHNGSALPFCDHTLPIPQRVADLLQRLTVEEKAHLIAIRGDIPDAGVARLGIPPYSWGIEILHGAGINCVGKHCPTILPVLACAASSFNRSAWHGMGAVISTEMRAANNNGGVVRPGALTQVGLNGWGPNINLARDPRWGRELEVPTEDPTLAGKLAASMTRGIQEGDDHHDAAHAPAHHLLALLLVLSMPLIVLVFPPKATTRSTSSCSAHSSISPCTPWSTRTAKTAAASRPTSRSMTWATATCLPTASA